MQNNGGFSLKGFRRLFCLLFWFRHCLLDVDSTEGNLCPDILSHQMEDGLDLKSGRLRSATLNAKP